MKIKRKIKKVFLLLPKFITNNIYKIYDYFLYPENRKKIENHSNYNKVVYIIRPRNNTVEGLMSLLLNATRHLDYVDKKEYIPYFDFGSLKTQYSDEKGTNIWEYYFKQGPITINEINRSNRIVFCGLSKTRTSLFDFDNWTKKEQIERSRYLFNKYIVLNEKTKNYIEKEVSKIDIKTTLGLYIRGTDYTKMKPIGHPIQPKVEDMFNKAEEYMEKYSLKKVFLVTEDYDIYKKASIFFGEKLIVASFDSFIKNYKGNNYLSNSEEINEICENKYTRGLNYLTKIVILSKLDYLIAGNTCGSWAASAFSKGFKDHYIFNLGNY